MKQFFLKHRKFAVISFILLFATLPFAEGYEEENLGCGAACFLFSWWLFLAPVWLYAAAIFLNIRKESVAKFLKKDVFITAIKLTAPIFLTLILISLLAYGYEKYDEYRDEQSFIEQRTILMEGARRHMERDGIPE